MSPVPTIGRIVLYTLKQEDVDPINRRRGHANEHMDEHRSNANGVQVHVGNQVQVGEVYPLVITRVWGPNPNSLINGQLLLDGNDLHWVTSVGCGEGPGTFAWPTRS